MPIPKDFSDRFFGYVKNTIHSFQNSLKHIPDARRREEAIQQIQEIYNDIIQSESADPKQLRNCLAAAVQAMRVVYIRLMPKSDSEKYKKFATANELAIKTTHAFAKVISIQEDVAHENMHQLLRHDWGFDLLYTLLLLEDQLALKLLVDELTQGSEIGIKVLEQLDKNYFEFKEIIEPLFSKLIDLAIKSEPLQIILQAYFVIKQEDGPLNQMLPLKMFEFDGNGGLPEDPSRLTTRAINLIKHFSKLKQVRKVNWDETSTHSKITFFTQYFTRQRQLIRFYRGELDVKSFIDPPQTKCFPETKCLIMAGRKDNWDVLNFICEALKKSKMKLIIFSQKTRAHLVDNLRQINRSIKGIYSPSDLDIWTQDYSSIQATKIKIPPSFIDPPKRKEYLISCRNKRMRERIGAKFDDADYFNTYGSVFEFAESYKAFEKFYALDPTFKNFSTQFTPIEGGLCLISRDKVFVGKDLLEYSRLILEEELKTLGVMAPKENLSDEQIKALIALDFGLDSPDKVNFIEQPNYHLDVASVVVKDDQDHPVVWVNDSLAAHREMCAYVEKHEQIQEVFRDDRFGRITYTERLERAEEDARILNQYENAAAEDFEKAGCRVIRLPLATSNPNRDYPENHSINFCNFSSFITPEGKKIIIVPGAIPYFETKFKEYVKEYIGEDVEIHFSSEVIARNLLSLHGALNCCIKRIGTSIMVAGI